MEELNEVKQLVLHIVRGIWAKRWKAIAICWVVLILGIAGVEQIENRYKAETKIYIDSTSVLKPLLRGLAIQSDFQSIVQLMAKQLLSRPNLERAANIMKLDRDVDGPVELERLIRNIRRPIVLSADKRTGIYTIGYTDTDRLVAVQMVQTLLDIFIDDTLGRSVTESDNAIEFLNQQISKYDLLLREAEDRREAFKRKNIGLMPKDGETYYAQLREVEGQIEDANRTLSELENRRDKLKFEVQDLESNETNQEVIVKTSLDLRIEDQEKNLDELLILYTEQHPDVINARYVLKTLRERKAQETNKVITTDSILNNPIYQELQISLSKTEADVSSFSARVRSLMKKKRELEKLVDIVPQIEAEMQRLNRDYEVHRRNYTELVARREQARISEDVESGSEKVKFKIIEPPFVPQRPTSPNRILFDLIVVVIALGIGYGFALLLSLLQPVFYNQEALRKAIPQAVLGAISKFDTQNVVSKRRKEVFFFSIANLLFFGVAGVTIFLHSRNVFVLDWLKNYVVT